MINDEHFEIHKSDCKEIVDICKKNYIHISITDAYSAWEEYSDRSAAGWLLFHQDQIDKEQEIIYAVKDFLDKNSHVEI